MHIEPLDPLTDTGRVLACHQITEAAAPVDDPNAPAMSLPAFRGGLAHGFGGNPQQAWLATDSGGAPVGYYQLELPKHDNTDAAYCFGVVSPGRRRAGTGRALLAHCAGQAARAGRSLLLCQTRDHSAGTSFLRAIGAQQGLTDLRRVLDVDNETAERMAGQRALAERRASGYSLLSWCGPAPDEYLDRVAAVLKAMADEPRDAGREAEVWDVGRVRAEETRYLAQGLTFYSVAARHNETGDLAALTQVGIDPLLPGWAFQLLTAVTRAHRGHKLGLLVKAAMQQLLAGQEPGLRRVMTFNNGQNEHMIAINEQLGYRVSDRFLSWDIEVAKVLAAAGTHPPAAPGSQPGG